MQETRVKPLAEVAHMLVYRSLGVFKWTCARLRSRLRARLRVCLPACLSVFLRHPYRSWYSAEVILPVTSVLVPGGIRSMHIGLCVPDQ